MLKYTGNTTNACNDDCLFQAGEKALCSHNSRAETWQVQPVKVSFKQMYRCYKAVSQASHIRHNTADREGETHARHDYKTAQVHKHASTAVEAKHGCTHHLYRCLTMTSGPLLKQTYNWLKWPLSIVASLARPACYRHHAHETPWQHDTRICK